MGEVFITRKGGGGGKASAPTIAVTEVGGTWIELEITNNDAAATGAQIFVLANYDPTSETEFDLQAAQNGYVFTVAEGATVTQLITGLDPAVTHTVSASAAVIKKLPSSIVTTAPTDLEGTGVTAPSLGPLVENNFTTSVITVTNNDTTISLVIKANVTTSTTPPTVYPFETASFAGGTSTNLTITGVTPETTFYIHARAFDGAFSSSNVVFGPYTTPEEPLYAFTNWTFTNAGVTGQTGPNITQVRSAYSSQSWAQNNAYLSMSKNGFQDWVVPITGTYRFKIRGANGVPSTGASSGCQGGQGIILNLDVTLSKNEVLRLMVGQSGVANGEHGSGGGASLVAKSPYNTTASIIGIAGGGGGRRQASTGVGIPGASFTTFQGYGTRNNSNSNAAVTTIEANGPSSNGGYTPTATTLSQGGSSGNSGYGNGGGGMFGNGFPDGSGPTTGGGRSLNGTAVGGDGVVVGGFGGGGSGQGGNGGGGGGGYTGGSGAHTAGGGGSWRGSFVSNYSEQFDGNVTQIGSISTLFHGYIQVTKL